MNDVALVAMARDGDPDATRELIARVWPLVWQWAYGVVGDRTLADHVAQDAVFNTFRSLQRFDPERPFRPWLKRITVNRAIDELRRRPGYDVAPPWMAELCPCESVEDGPELAGQLVDAVRRLPPRQRIVLALHYWLDYSVEDIAEVLEIAVGTVVSRLSRARAQLRTELEEDHAR